MVTRLKTGCLKPRVYFALCQSPCSSLTVEPMNVNAALADPKWRLAMSEEYDALMRNNTWLLVPPADGMNIVGNKCIFRTKYKPNGSVLKYKARLVARGSSNSRCGLHSHFQSSYKAINNSSYFHLCCQFWMADSTSRCEQCLS